MYNLFCNWANSKPVETVSHFPKCAKAHFLRSVRFFPYPAFFLKLKNNKFRCLRLKHTIKLKSILSVYWKYLSTCIAEIILPVLYHYIYSNFEVLTFKYKLYNRFLTDTEKEVKVKKPSRKAVVSDDSSDGELPIIWMFGSHWLIKSLHLRTLWQLLGKIC